MKLDRVKIKEVRETLIKRQRELKDQQGLAASELSLYATYLYTAVSHARNHLHMKWWNRNNPEAYTPDGVGRYGSEVRSFSFEVDSLAAQHVWLEMAKKYLHRARAYQKALFGLPLEFPTLPETPLVLHQSDGNPCHFEQSGGARCVNDAHYSRPPAEGSPPHVAS